MPSPQETYGKMIQYGLRKAKLTRTQLFLQSVSASMWITVFGHSCTYLAMFFYDKNSPPAVGLSKIIFGLLFPPALVAIVFTGSELFTGNTVTMMMCWMDQQISVDAVFRVWNISLFGNFVGAVLGAYLSTVTGAFDNDMGRQFISAFAAGKTGKPFGPTLLLGVGCNLLVCLAIWCASFADEAVGKAACMMPPITVFVVGGFEHIIANFYFLFTAYFMNVATVSEIFLNNFFPVLLGNLIAGVGLTAMLWWYNFHPKSTPADLLSEKQLVAALASRVSFAGVETHGATPGPEEKRLLSESGPRTVF